MLESSTHIPPKTNGTRLSSLPKYRPDEGCENAPGVAARTLTVADASYIPLPGRRRLFSSPMPQRIGDFLQRRQDMVRLVQRACVAFYLFLLLTPVFMPLPALVVVRELWWPAVILATLLFGQFWCGLFCPDGTLTEFISRHGRAGKIPLKLRWFGWPLLAFSIITVAEHLLDTHRSSVATLALLGGGSLAAWATGYFLGRGKRIWCRYLCPAGSLFSLLARGAMFHYRVDRATWDAAPRPLPRPVDCPQLLDVRRLHSNEKCNMCGRCSGHRNAVVLALRVPGQEIAALREEEANPRDAFAICFVLIGLCYGVACGRAGPLGNGLQGLSGSGLLISAATLLLTALLLGASVAALLWLGAAGRIRRAGLLAYGLIPLAGTGSFVSALEYAIGIIGRSGVGALAWTPWLRVPLLLAGSAWAIAIGLVMTARLDATPIGRAGAAVAHVLAVSLVATCYLLAPL